MARRRARSSSVGHGTAPPRSLSVAPVIMDLSAVAAAGPGADAAWRPVPGGPGASHRGLHLLYWSDATFFLTLWLPVGGLPALRVCTYGAVSPCALFFFLPFLAVRPRRVLSSSLYLLWPPLGHR